MKHLILLRHANTENATTGQKDFDRALTAQGRRDATEVAKGLRNAAIVPHLIICSAAQRAQTTATLLAMQLEIAESQLLIDARIYSASVAELLAIIRTAPPCERLLLVGHNPTISELADRLASDTRIPALPTCGMVSMIFETDHWDQVNFGAGTNVLMDSPDNSLR